MEGRESKYEGMKDEILVGFARKGDQAAQDFLIYKYKDLVKLQARMYFIIGADREDIIQEGMIGLFKAIRDYNPEKSDLFYAFARMCVTRQIQTAIKAATRQKHIPLNNYISLNRAISEDEPDKTILNIRSSQETSPEDLLIGREERQHMENHIVKVLSRLETQVLSLFLQGRSYEEISRIISKDEKSIDNALQRVRRKMSGFRRDKNSQTKGAL